VNYSQYAIARVYAQLTAKRRLTPEERAQLALLRRIVRRYEKEEK
jgi:hypothetical protein